MAIDEDLIVKFRTQGQRLILVSKAPLATGAISATHVQIEFDPSWEQFPQRLVHFYKSWTTKSAIVPMSGEPVPIPAEILEYFVPENTGHWDPTCWINAAGVGDHKTITTNRIRLEIALGEMGEAPMDPSPTLYEQLLNAIESGGIIAPVLSVNDKLGHVQLYTDDIPEKQFASNHWMTTEEREGLRKLLEEGFTANHDELEHLDWPDQHPIEAIIGLREELEKKNDYVALSIVDGQLCVTYDE